MLIVMASESRGLIMARYNSTYEGRLPRGIYKQTANIRHEGGNKSFIDYIFHIVSKASGSIIDVISNK